MPTSRWCKEREREMGRTFSSMPQSSCISSLPMAYVASPSSCHSPGDGGGMYKVAVDYDTGDVLSSGVGGCDEALIMDMVLANICYSCSCARWLLIIKMTHRSWIQIGAWWWWFESGLLCPWLWRRLTTIAMVVVAMMMPVVGGSERALRLDVGK